MKITDIKPFIVSAKKDNWVYVKVYTDEGISGVGECSLEGRELTVSTAVEEIKRHLVGKDPMNVEKNFFRVFRDSYWGAGAVLTSALSAVDMACWDIKGKALGVPVYQLLGGRFRDKVRVYANRWFFGGDTPAKLAKLAEETVKKGYTGLKWDPFYCTEATITPEQLRGVIEQVKTIREAVGWDVDLLIEGHGRFNPYTAVRIANELAPYKPYFFEEPVIPENYEASAYVRDHSPVPIASGERWCTKTDWRMALNANAVDIAQPDLRICGGITEAKKIAALCEANQVPIAPHNVHGQIGTAASMHLACAIPNIAILEYSIDDEELKESLFNYLYTPVNGYIKVNDRPGLGIDLNEEVALAHPFKTISMVMTLYPENF